VKKKTCINTISISQKYTGRQNYHKFFM